jgi:hypothetical protein
VAKKNPAAVQLGKLRKEKGPPLNEVGRLGGIARKEKLSEEERKSSASRAGKRSAAKLTAAERKRRARAAAAARWEKKA